MAITKNGLFKFDSDTGDAYECLKKLFGNAETSNMDIIDNLITALQNGKATVENKTATIGTSWNGDNAPYSQEIAVDGLFATDAPIVDIVLSETLEAAKQEEKDWAKVYRIVASANAIKVYAKEKTTVALNIKMQVVR